MHWSGSRLDKRRARPSGAVRPSKGYLRSLPQQVLVAIQYVLGPTLAGSDPLLTALAKRFIVVLSFLALANVASLTRSVLLVMQHASLSLRRNA